jgi:RNase P/RNase MRP subunit POP5
VSQEQKKLKPFMPSMKEKNRYLLFKGKKEELFGIIKEFLGIYNYSQGNFKIIYEDDNFFLLKCTTKIYDLIRASLCLYNHNLRIVKVYGTIKKFKDEFDKLKVKFENDEKIN